MTAPAGNVGGTEIPTPVGAPNTPIADVVANGLLGYLGHWIKYALDPKLATMGGPTTAGPVADACPVANRHPYPPRGWWQRPSQPVPALYIWTNENVPMRTVPYSTIYNWRVRSLNVRYIFPEVAGPDGQSARAGILQLVDAVFRRASERGSHPTYENGKAFVDTVASPGTLEWAYETGAVEYMFGSIPDVSNVPGGRSSAVREHGFPSLLGTIMVAERIGADSMTDPDDVFTGGILADIKVTGLGDTNDALHYMNRILPHPDGSEDGDEDV